MQGKGFKEYLEWLIVGVFILLIIGMGARLTIGQEAEIGIYLNSTNSSYSLDSPLNVSNDTGANTYGIFIENDTTNLFTDLTINATLSVEQTASVAGNYTIGIFANGTFEEGAQIRPIGNLTITDTGTIQVSANGTAVLAGGIAIGNVTDNLINNGTISVFGNVTDSSGQLMVGGVYVENAATNVVNNGNVTVNGTGGYVNYAENNVPVGFEIASLGNFTNTGNINVSIESVNATAVGVRSYEIGYFNNTGNISVFTNSTSGDMSAVIGVMAGQPDVFGEQQPGHIGTFVNSGNLTVTGYASGTELYAFGVIIFNGTIDNFQNSAGGRIEVYGNNIGGNATVYGVGAFSDDVGYGNLTNFINAGLINATAIGNNATSSGVHADDYIGDFTNEAGGSITVTANATDGDAEASGVNAGSIGNFTNKGDISVIANGTSSAYGLGVYGASIGNFTNEGNINAYISASNGGIVAGLMSGIPQIFGSPEPGHISSFINSGNLKVSGYASGTELYAFGVAVFNGTIDEFQNLSGGKIEVYGENTNGQAGAYGVYAENGIGNFTNNGSITVIANGTNSAYASGVEAGDIDSAGDIGSFTGNGTIFVSATASNGYAGASGVSAYGNIDDFKLERGGIITVTASGTAVFAGGVLVGNVTDNLINNGTISVFGNVTDSSGQLMVGGVYVENAATNVVNNGNVTVNGTGGYVNYAENNVPAGFEIASLGNFTNTGNINVSIESINATAVGVRSYEIGYFNNTGNISVFTNSTSGDFSEVIGVMAGKPQEFEGLTSGQISTFVNSGNLTVTGYASGGKLYAYGVAVFNGTIDEFQNLLGGKIEVYGENTNGQAEAYGVYAENGIGNFTNVGEINVSVNSNATSENAGVFGVKVGSDSAVDIDNFINSGKISANVSSNTTGAIGAYGIYVYGDIENFVLESGGEISANANAEYKAVAYGVVANNIANFISIGSISASANTTNNNAEAYGVYLSESLGNFTLKSGGQISANASSTNGNAIAYGVDVVSGDIGNFTNTGNIWVSAQATNGDAYAPGVKVWSSIGNFTNTGDISVAAQATNGRAYAYGVNAGDIGNFSGNGTIFVSATASNGDAEAYGVSAGNIDDFKLEGGGIITVTANGTSSAYALGIYQDGGNIGNFTNEGSINVIANATEVYAEVYASGLYYADSIGNFTNNGSISVIANGEDSAYASGVEAGDIGSFTGNGTISVSAISSNGDAEAYGILADGNIEDFKLERGGIITVTANTANETSSAEAYGVGANYIGNFTNTGTFEITAIATNGTASAYGVYAGDIGSFTGNGAIFVSAISSNGGAEARGILADGNIEDFKLERGGIITVTANGTSSAHALGVEAGGIGSFASNGTIFVSATSSNGDAVAYGVYSENGIGNFTLESGGEISASATSTNGDTYAYGVRANIIGNFTNAGNIVASANGTSRARAYGVRANIISNFTNAGSIVTSANGTDWAVSDGVFGEDSIGNFTNAGNIIASATSTNGVAEAFGILAGDVGNFTNAGTINITATATNGTAKADGLNVGAVDSIENFTNNGTIKVTATGKDAEAYGLYAVFLTGTLLNDSSGNIQVSAQGEQSANATGIYVEKAQTGSTIFNKGLIDVSAISTSGSVNSIGIYLKDSNTTLTNNGTIKVYASGNVDKVAGIYITNSTVELSNPGEVVVWGDVPSGAKIRTLYVDTGSNVTLKDKFAITFGAPGTGPNIAPIYVASGSALDLNSTTLVVRLWNNSTQYIVVNTPYSIIEYNGTVNGNWGGLEKGYINPLIDVTWYNSTITNKDAQIIFKYSALNNPEQALGPVSSITGGVIINSIMVDNVFTFLPITSPLILVKGYQPIMLASSGVSDVGAGYSLGGVEYRGGMWFKPLYTYVDADDLGFDTDAYGFNIGLGGFLTKNFSLGIYANYLRAEYDYSISSAKDGDSDIFSVGIAGMWKMMKDTYLRYNVYGFSSSNDYHGRTGFNFELKEKASYNMNGVHAEILIGKVYRGKLNIIPEIGIKYTYYNPESFWTKVYDSAGNRVSSWDRYYDPDNKHMWKGLVGVMVAGETKAGGIPVNLFAYGRLEQAFGENDISALNYMRSDPTRWEISKEINRTTFIVQLGGEFMLQKNLGLEISGRGDFNGDYSGYTGKVMLRYSW